MIYICIFICIELFFVHCCQFFVECFTSQYACSCCLPRFCVGFVYHFVICNISRIMLILDIHVSILLKDVTQCSARLLITNKKNSLLFSCWILFRIKKKWYESISSISDFHLVEVIERVFHRLEQTCVLFV